MKAYIVNGLRTAVGRANKGIFKSLRSDDLAVNVIDSLLKSVPKLDPKEVDDLIVGCAYPEGEQGLQMGRLISLMALPINVPGFIVNRFCASGLEAIAIATQRIEAGMADVIIAGGTESMSRIPRNGYHPSANPQLKLNHPDYLISMGLTAENVAKKYRINREDQDIYSYHSHLKANIALNSELFKNEIVPIEHNGVLHDIDECPRPSTSPEILATLAPAFKENGVVTAGNSSPMNDGASFVIVMSEKMIKRLGIIPKSRMLSYAIIGVDPAIMGVGPIEAIPRALKKAGLNLSDIDLIELNEAFAAQTLAVIRELRLDPHKINVNGGAIALGHPLGATGAKLTTQLMNEMIRKKHKYGMVTACVGGGQGVAGIFENLKL